MKVKSKSVDKLRRERLGQLICAVSGRKPVVLHHCKGGSMRDLGVHAGTAMKVHDRYLIPLHPDYHTGDYGIHTIGVESWEAIFGRQADLLEQVNELLDNWD